MGEVVLRFAGGALLGCVGTLVGTGGGWALVPLFLFGFGLAPREAAATSLCVVFANALSGTLSAVDGRRVWWSLAAILGLASLPGAWLGPLLGANVSTALFIRLFALVLAVTAAAMWVRDLRVASSNPVLTSRVVVSAALVSGLVGVVSSVLGVGGGIFHVPFLVLGLGVAVPVAAATSQAALVVTSLAGALSYGLGGAIHWDLAGPLGAGAVVGAQLGAWVGQRVSGVVVRRVFCVVLLCCAGVLVAFPRAGAHPM